ncbi:MAG: UDP-N-acetylmuramoyl-L-alanyl-D-glutamate--2,6-diaminopimelate ligase [Flavobacteriales bacterium]|nr:UDP-N-acetylmuramoyl-L-alanyl-D-glutamate--2,6-diaminopimelate ligase [Flavobacteriales bacterium]
MKLLKDILYRASITSVTGSTNIAIENICFDSREVSAFSAFVCVRGTQVDGHQFINQAIESGAIAIICEELPKTIKENITYVQVQDTHKSLAYMACNFYDNPSEKLKLIGITGTNGKTTTATLMHQLFQNLGNKCGLLSTVVNKIEHEEIPSTHTTPNPIELNKLLDEMVQHGCTYCFMEVSSHALVQHRATGLDFNVAIFSNISHDHLDYHGTFDEYIKAKKMLFDNLPSTAFSLVNRDDFHNEVMVQNTKSKVYTYGLKTMADYKCRVIENDFSGLQLNINGKDLWTRLVGRFNAYNILCVYATAILMGEKELDVLTEISKLTPVVGRFQYLKSNSGIVGVVDYAHTPDALKKVLETIKDIRTGNEQVITVVGCGGDRDKTKRPEMGKIACTLSDKAIFTSDNPRSENPEAIIKDMEAGVEPIHFKKTLSIVNRKDAIKTAVSMAHEGDIILIAGKGHETYQIIGKETFHFSDIETIKEFFKQFAV